jgi:hypothetical protein
VTVFSNPEAFALLLVMRAVDAQERSAHARAVVQELGFDPRLEVLVPLRPARGKQLRTYERVLTTFGAITALPEPERTGTIDQLLAVVAAARK